MPEQWGSDGLGGTDRCAPSQETDVVPDTSMAGVYNCSTYLKGSNILSLEGEKRIKIV